MAIASSRKKSTGKYLQWITEDGCLQLQGMAKDGLTDKDISHNIGISPQTLYEWKKKYPEIALALSEGKDVADRRVENALYKRALGFEYDETKTVTRIVNGKVDKDAEVTKIRKVVVGDVTAQIIWLKNRKPEMWRRGEDRDNKHGEGVEDLAPLADLLRVDKDEN